MNEENKKLIDEAIPLNDNGTPAEINVPDLAMSLRVEIAMIAEAIRNGDKEMSKAFLEHLGIDDIPNFGSWMNRNNDMKNAIEKAAESGDFDGIEIRGIEFEKDGRTYDGARLYPSTGEIEDLDDSEKE